MVYQRLSKCSRFVFYLSGQLEVDGEKVTGKSKGPATMINGISKLYAGGVPKGATLPTKLTVRLNLFMKGLGFSEFSNIYYIKCFYGQERTK